MGSVHSRIHIDDETWALIVNVLNDAACSDFGTYHERRFLGHVAEVVGKQLPEDVMFYTEPELLGERKRYEDIQHRHEKMRHEARRQKFPEGLGEYCGDPLNIKFPL